MKILKLLCKNCKTYTEVIFRSNLATLKVSADFQIRILRIYLKRARRRGVFWQYCSFYFTFSREVSWFFDSQNHWKSFQTVFRSILGIFPGIFYFYENFDFLTILVHRALQNVPVGTKICSKWPFWVLLGHFVWPGGPKWSKNRNFHKNKKCREKYPESI